MPLKNCLLACRTNLELKNILATIMTSSFCRVLAERLFLCQYLLISVAVRLYLRHFSVAKVS